LLPTDVVALPVWPIQAAERFSQWMKRKGATRFTGVERRENPDIPWFVARASSAAGCCSWLASGEWQQQHGFLVEG